MATASIGGLASGLDTASIVSQLMALEKVPQDKLKRQLGNQQSVLSALQSLNTGTAALATRAKELSSVQAWDKVTSTSSLTGLTVEAGNSTALTSFDVTPRQLATSHGETFTHAAALEDVVVPIDAVTGKRLVTITHQDGTPIALDTGDGTLRSLSAAINAGEAGAGVRSTLLQVGPGSYRLVVDSTSTGAASSFGLAAPAGSLLGGPEAGRTRSGQDAVVEVSGFTLTSPTNTFPDVVLGVSLTLGRDTELNKVGTVTVTRDAGERLASVKGLVDNVNQLLSTIAVQTSFNTAAGTSGWLSGNAVVRSLRNTLSTTLYPADGSSMAQYGLQVDRTGNLVLDEDTFAKAYAADPEKVASLFATGPDSFASRVASVAEKASDKYTGSLTSSITSQQSSITRLNTSIASWDSRLEMRRSTLERQYAALESALSQLNGQGNYLSTQLASLNASKG